MNTALIIGKIAALFSLCILCISLSLVFFHANRTLTAVDGAVVGLNTVVINLNKSLVEVNRPCVQGGDSCGTIADFNRTLRTLRGTLGQVEAAAIHENKQLGTLDAQEQALYADVHATLFAGQKTLEQSTTLLTTANQTVKGVQPLIVDAQGSVAALTQATHSLNTVLSDPSIPATLKAAQNASEQLAGASVEVKGMAVEGHQWLHSMLHPTWPGRAYHVGLDLAHAFNPF